jgi:hypothetical protein
MLEANYHSQRFFKPNTMNNSRSYAIICQFDSYFGKVVYAMYKNPHFIPNWSSKMTRGLYKIDYSKGVSNTSVR